MTKAKEQLEKASKIIEEKNIDGFLNLITDKNGLVDGLDLNTLYTLLEKYRAEYKKEVEKTEKKINKADKEVKLNYEELIKITTEFQEDINKKYNLKRGHELRKKPKYNREIAEEVQKKIEEKGLYHYLDDIISKIYIGDNKNIIRKILLGFNVIRGKGSYLCETVAKSGAGKSLEDEIAFLISMPEENIFIKDDMTFASFTRYDTNYFDRKIIYFGDFGSKKSFEKIEPVFNIMKKLVTEKHYSRDVSERIDGTNNWEVLGLDLEAESIGSVYSTVISHFTDDEQLDSRTINFTPVDTEEKETQVLDYIFCCFNKNTPEYIEREKAINELKKFQEYLKMLVNQNLEIIIPYKRIFIDFSLNADVPKRELTQQLELFEAYTILSNFNCKNHNNKLVASQKQVKDYFNNIALENALKPHESNFLKMIMAKDKKNELTIINDNVKDEGIGLNTCFNRVLEEMQTPQKNLIDDENLGLDDLNYNEEKIFIKKLINYYGLGSRSSKHEKNIFFTVNLLKAQYKNSSDYKNINDVPKLLMTLENKGYLDKLDYKHNKQNIYYLTNQCFNITDSVKLTEKDIIEADEFLNNNIIQ